MADIVLMKKKESGFLLLYGKACFRPSNWSREVTLVQIGYRASDIFKRRLVGSSPWGHKEADTTEHSAYTHGV